MIFPAWAGWLALLAAVGVFAYLYVKQRRNRAWERENPVSWSIHDYSGFPYTTIPIDVSRERGYDIVMELHSILHELWAEMAVIYDETPKGYGFHTLHLVHGEVAPEHPHIVLHLGPGVITARIQPALPFYWAGEIHNAFRGMLGLKSGEKLMAAKQAQWFIEEHYA